MEIGYELISKERDLTDFSILQFYSVIGGILGSISISDQTHTIFVAFSLSMICDMVALLSRSFICFFHK